MSILEIIVLLIGLSVISVLLYGAYQFWTEDSGRTTQPKPKERKTSNAPGPVQGRVAG